MSTDQTDAARAAGAQPTTAAKLPLSGLKVIDLTRARAGPTAVRHLADWGADVIRIDEPPAPGLEDLVGNPLGSDYQNLHRNKRSIRLNLKNPAGHAVLMDLVKDADVLLENMRPAVKERLGITYEQLSKINPRLVYGSISGFGQEGPYRDRPGVDQIAQGMTGLMSVTGETGTDKPMRTGIAVGDVSAGNMLALNVMIALYERNNTGRGRWVHTSLIESLLFMMDFQAARWLVEKQVAAPVGNEHPTGIPTGVFPTADGQVNMAAATPRMWSRLCQLLDKPEWDEKPEWKTKELRSKNRAGLHAAIGEVMRTKPSKYWIDTFSEGGIPCGPIYKMNEVFEDPQVQKLGMAAPMDHPTLGRINLVASPLNFEGVPKKIRNPIPKGGADAEQILSELGYSAEKIRELHASGAC